MGRDQVSRKECTICSCEEEQVSLAVAFARAFSLGTASQRHDTLELYLRECLCLRHCDLFSSIGRGAYGMQARSRRGLKRSQEPDDH